MKLESVLCRITKYHCWQKHWELIHCGFWAFPIYHNTAAMKIDRLMGIVTILLQQGKVTAPELARRFGVMSIPTLLVFKGGEIAQTAVGARPKADILALLD